MPRSSASAPASVALARAGDNADDCECLFQLRQQRLEPFDDASTREGDFDSAGCARYHTLDAAGIGWRPPPGLAGDPQHALARAGVDGLGSDSGENFVGSGLNFTRRSI